MGWYNFIKTSSRLIYALRKHNLNADLHIHCASNMETGEDIDPVSQATHMRGICGAAILKGLDVIGIVSGNSFEPGMICKQLVETHDYDLLVLPGKEIVSGEKIRTIVYNAQTIPQDGEGIEDVCLRAHRENGAVMVIQPSKRNMQHLNNIAGKPNSPDFIEVFNDMSKSGYMHVFIDVEAAPEYHLIVNSAARSASDLDKSVMISRIPRNRLVELGLLDEKEGVDYTPPYLKPRHQALPQMPPTTS